MNQSSTAAANGTDETFQLSIIKVPETKLTYLLRNLGAPAGPNADV
jgi:hypothetical protein